MEIDDFIVGNKYSVILNNGLEVAGIYCNQTENFWMFFFNQDTQRFIVVWPDSICCYTNLTKETNDALKKRYAKTIERE